MHVRSRHQLVTLPCLAAAALVSICLVASTGLYQNAEDRPTSQAASSTGAGRPLELPPAFVPNAGQWDDKALFAARFGATTLHLCDDGWVASFSDRQGVAAVRMRFLGAADAVDDVGELSDIERWPALLLVQ